MSISGISELTIRYVKKKTNQSSNKIGSKAEICNYEGKCFGHSLNVLRNEVRGKGCEVCKHLIDLRKAPILPHAKKLHLKNIALKCCSSGE